MKGKRSDFRLTAVLLLIFISLFSFAAFAANGTEGRNSIEEGINNAINASIFTDQKVYIRYMNDTQKQGMFDKVAAYLGQRWLFNYITAGESSANMSGIGENTINIWENSTLTSEQIARQVGSFVNGTKIG